jgi:hypothetical protein
MGDKRVKKGDQPAPSPRQPTPTEKARMDELFSRLLRPEERARLERLLLSRLKERKTELEQLLAKLGSHWTHEDGFYRYYHQSFKVYGVQAETERAVRVLRDLLPERKLNVAFENIIHDGTGKEFQMEHNRDWARHTRPLLEAFCHAKFMIEMAVRYADLPEPPQPMPSGWAALLYLYDLR